VVESSALMNGQRELVIRHNGQTYRLRVTTSDTLILTK
jgi:hemin uptake protein HemP